MNVYYDPQDFELEIVECLEQEGLCYEYNMLLVVCHKPTHEWFYCTDSGCSCPTPFEGYFFSYDEKLQAFNTNMERLTWGNIANACLEIRKFPADSTSLMRKISQRFD